VLNNKQVLILTLLIVVLANVSVVFLSEYQRFRDRQEQAIRDKQQAEVLIRLLKAEAKKRQLQEQNRRAVSDVLRKHSAEIVANSKKQQQEFTKELNKHQEETRKMLDSQPKLEIPNTTDEERY
jgi:type II secretory pathway component PulK